MEHSQELTTYWDTKRISNLGAQKLTQVSSLTTMPKIRNQPWEKQREKTYSMETKQHATEKPMGQ